jgi:predicted transcriptional regulator
VKYDESKIDEVVLALLGATEFENGRVWKRIDFGVMDRLHEQGYITDPKGKQESVRLTEKGLALAKTLASKYFAR